MKTYQGNTFTIKLNRYSDPDRSNLARNAAIYVGKPDYNNLDRPLLMLRQGNLPEIFNGEFAEFEFSNVSKEVYDYFAMCQVRNMHVSYGNRSAASDEHVLPSGNVRQLHLARLNSEGVLRHYKTYIDSVGKSEANDHLRVKYSSSMRHFVYQFNFSTLIQTIFSHGRFKECAQENVVSVLRGMWQLVHTQDPELWDTVFENFGAPAHDWASVGESLKKVTVDELVNDLMNGWASVGSDPAFDVLCKFLEKKDRWEKRKGD